MLLENMKSFLGSDFLLYNKASQKLYHEFAAAMPIIDYHCHLPAQQIAEDHQFGNLTQAWLYGDHYKWRAMRANGIHEKFITGNASDRDKFQKWAETVPYLLRNPLYHWTHLELQRYFGIEDILNADSAEEIYNICSEKLNTPEFNVQNLLKKINVKLVCTTDDPADDLKCHQQLKKDFIELPVLPAFRPDAAMNVDDAIYFNAYLSRLGKAADQSIVSFDDFLAALKKRHNFFAENGCSVSDHGLEEMYAEDFTEPEIKTLFVKLRNGINLEESDKRKFKSAMLMFFSEWDHEKSWVQQFHLGALRNNNARLLQQIGADAGLDSIGDFSQAKSLSKFLNNLDRKNKLSKTILYNLNPGDNEMMATMIGNFNDGSVAGKMQWGSAWWFLDQKDGITKQLNALSNMGLLSRFIGMLTDSRSFLSFPRHEYFRRILCNLFGEEIENGELPNDIKWIGKLIQDICFNNAKNYFGWDYLQ